MKWQRMAELILGLMGGTMIVSAAYVIASGGIKVPSTGGFFRTPERPSTDATEAWHGEAMTESLTTPETMASRSDSAKTSHEPRLATSVQPAIAQSRARIVPAGFRDGTEPDEEMEPLPEPAPTNDHTSNPPRVDRTYQGTPHNPRTEIEKRRAAKARVAEREDGHMQPRRAADDEMMTIRSSSSTPEAHMKGSGSSQDERPRTTLAHSAPRPTHVESPAPKASPSSRMPAKSAGVKETYGTTRQFFPPGNRAAAAVILERVTPAEVRLGNGMTYELKVTNTTGCGLTDVMLYEHPPEGMEVRSTEPKVDKIEDGFSWAIGTLAARETRTLVVTGTAKQVGDLRGCATVTFNTSICSATRVVEPSLQLVKTAPDTVMLCDTIPVKLRVSNTGSGAAKNVRITDTLPDGWMTIDGQRSLTYAVGDLAAGESREYAATLKSSTIGEFTNQATATEDGGLNAEASTKTVVLKPELEITKTGPGTRYIGRPAKYEITVANRGNATAVDTVLTDEVPGGTQFVESTDGGTLKGGRVVWRLGDLNPGESKSVTVTLKPTEKGTYTNTVEAKSYCAEAVASATTKAEGVPAMLLEVVDLEDPIEVGAETTYEIYATNQGTAEGTNVVINVTLPPELEFISASGPVNHTVGGQEIRFAPLPRLAEKGQAVYRVKVRGLEGGDVRFRCNMTSDQLQTPVEESESTHIYR
ncbi:MAG: hypothetical protein HBSAPP02_22980 [Phycisphaerae bacterium]|nr:MAG: DUF11 domain-containing protein [Planctomycetia bacterium]GJQ27266.1 MAG: hypothetical protein HBSAPP02_22980 [Phycisphaerae bacterium]